MIYLDNAATTFPKPVCMGSEISKCINKYCGNPGRSSHLMAIKSAEKVYEARELLAKMFGSDIERVIFTYNTTYALNIAIKSLIKYSSHVLISDIEHNSVVRPIYNLSREKLCTYDVFSTNGSDEEIISCIKSLITKNTSLIVCTCASNVGERRLPIKKIGELCRIYGIKLIVDGAQGAGIHQINVKEMNIDALCIPAHKGLYGPQGLGMIVFGTDEIGRSVIEGGTGINSLEAEMPDFLPERYEAGTMSTPLIAGLCESLKWLEEIGIDRIRLYEERLYSYLYEILSNDKRFCVYKMNEYNGNTLMFNVIDMPHTIIGTELNKRGICVRTGLHCSPFAHKLLNTPGGAVRVSFSVFNSKSDVNSLYEALCSIVSSK